MRRMILEHLNLGDGHMAEGTDHVQKQGEVVEELERDGHDTCQARQLLAQFGELLAFHIADRERLKKELEETRG